MKKIVKSSIFRKKTSKFLSSLPFKTQTTDNQREYDDASESRINCTADHLVEAERILQRMIEKNPALQKLIDDLGLVLVGASPIGSGDGNPP